MASGSGLLGMTNSCSSSSHSGLDRCLPKLPDPWRGECLHPRQWCPFCRRGLNPASMVNRHAISTCSPPRMHRPAFGCHGYFRDSLSPSGWVAFARCRCDSSCGCWRWAVEASFVLVGMGLSRPAEQRAGHRPPVGVMLRWFLLEDIDDPDLDVDAYRAYVARCRSAIRFQPRRCPVPGCRNAGYRHDGPGIHGRRIPQHAVPCARTASELADSRASTVSKSAVRAVSRSSALRCWTAWQQLYGRCRCGCYVYHMPICRHGFPASMRFWLRLITCPLACRHSS